MTSGKAIDVSSVDEFKRILKEVKGVCVLNFWASWALQCQHMNEVFDDLAKQYPDLTFLKVTSGVNFPYL
jgi:thiol-disulfide isomerase/thioredoxin